MRPPPAEETLLAAHCSISLPSLLMETALVRRHRVLPRGCIYPSDSLLPTRLPRIAVGWVWTRFRLTKCKGISWGTLGKPSFLRKETHSGESSFVLPSPRLVSCPVGIRYIYIHEGSIMVILGVTEGALNDLCSLHRVPLSSPGPPAPRLLLSIGT